MINKRTESVIKWFVSVMFKDTIMAGSEGATVGVQRDKIKKAKVCTLLEMGNEGRLIQL